MIRRQAVKNTDNPPGQIVNPIPDAITEKNIQQWREYEYSRNSALQPVKTLKGIPCKMTILWDDGTEVRYGIIPASGEIGGVA